MLKALVLVAIALGLAPACKTKDPAVAAICKAPNVDGTSELFVGRDASGAVVRYEATPSRNMADMGTLYFDASGKYLGTGMGGEGPEDEATRAELRKKEDGLRGGATYTSLGKPCG